MRICFIVPNLGHMGGSVSVTANLANRLACDGYDVTVVSCGSFDAPAFDLETGIRTQSLDFGEERVLQRARMAQPLLNACFEDHRPAIVFGVGTYETLFAIRPCAKHGIPLVFCDHGALINQWADKKMRAIRYLDARNAGKTVVLTRKSLEDYANMLRIPRRKLECIPNWIPRELVEASHAYNAQSRALLWAGRLDKEKGVDHLIEIARRVLPSRPEWVWNVYGQRVVAEGADFDIDNAIEDAGLTDQLCLMGRADNMFELYDQHAVCTLTSYREGLPLTLLEGKACGLPLIAFDVNTGPRDIIEEGVDGFLVTPYDYDEYAEKLGRLMDDDALRTSMSMASQRTVGYFSEDAIFAKWITLIEELTA